MNRGTAQHVLAINAKDQYIMIRQGSMTLMEYYGKDEATSPTIATEAVFLTTVIDAMEERCVAVIDVAGAFLQADMPEGETVHLRLTGIMVDTLLKIDQD